MRFLIRLAVVAVVVLIAIGLYRGWSSVTAPKRDAEGDKVQFGVSVDPNKMKGDLKKAKEDIKEEVQQYQDRHDKEGTKKGGS